MRKYNYLCMFLLKDIVKLLILLILFFSCNSKHSFFSGDSLNVQAYKFLVDNSSENELKEMELKKELLQNEIGLAINTTWNSIESGVLPINYFFEYVLPAKIFDEPIENWRELCYEKYKYLINAPFQVICDSLNFQIKRDYRFGTSAPSHITSGWHKLSTSKSGDCFHIAKILTYELRSIGIPASIDIAQWGNAAGIHCWTVAWDNGRMRPFMETQEKGVTIYSPFIIYENKSDKERSIYRYPAKVYRKTYSVNKEIEKMQQLLDSRDIPPMFLDKKMTDVSSEYFKTIDLSYMPVSKDSDYKIIYLSTFSKDWRIAVPTWYDTGNSVLFKNINPDLLYLPSFYHNREVIPAGAPIVIDENAHYKELVPNFRQLENVCVKYLYPLQMEYANAWAKLNELPNDYLEKLVTGKYRQTPVSGQRYSLYYWSDRQWNLISEAKAKNNMLVFQNAPSNALFILGDKEAKPIGRPFTFDNKNIKWW